MKIVKTMAVSFSFRTFLIVRRQRLCVTSLIGFRLGAGAPRLVTEILLWPAIAAATSGIVDEGLPKARAEMLLYGSCHTPGGLPLPATTVRVRVTRPDAPPNTRPLVDKRLRIFGDRYWDRTASKGPTTDPIPHSTRSTDPLPFTEMPLVWERAFGGANHPENPSGRGTCRVDTGDGIERVALPNIELASNRITSSSQRPDPTGFGPIDVTWPQRQSLAGTYGAKWLEEDFPGYARDTDLAFFNTASPDQRIDGFFRGDEEYILENVHPTRPVVRDRLPGAAARVLVRRKGSQAVEDVKMNLDTLVFIPGQEIGILVFRGTTPVLEDDASDVSVALAACEDLSAPRPLEHYAASLDRRLDKDLSPLLSLNEDDLLPSFAAGGGVADLLGKLQDPTKDIRERAFERARQQARKQGVPEATVEKMFAKSPLLERLERLPDLADPKDAAEYLAAIDDLDARADQVREEMEQGAQKTLCEAQQELKERLEKLGPHATPEVRKAFEEGQQRLEQMRRTLPGQPAPAEDAPPTGAGPPKPQPERLETMRQANMPAAFVAFVGKADGMALESYRGSAHYRPPARLLDSEARARALAEVMGLRAAGRSFAELDWTRHDLSGLDLQGANLCKTLLEGADLTRTNLAWGNLAGAVLAHAVLRETCFDGAILERTNLGAARVEGASFAGANLRHAVFARSKLRSVSFKGADLTGADWLEAEFGAVDFEAVVADNTSFLYKVSAAIPKRGQKREEPVPVDLSQCRFARARFKKANFLHAILDGVDFTEADLELVTFLSVRADGGNFRGACLRKLHAVMGCSFVGASFQGADLTGAFLRGANLRGANFEGACLESADLSECDLTGATLSRTQAKKSFFIHSDLTGAKLQGANLMEAMLMKATLHGADLTQTNLFAANLGLIRTDTATRVDGANLKRALMLPRAPKTT